MSQRGNYASSWRDQPGENDASSLRSDGREPGARRKKLAGYLKAANELRQTYQQSYTSSWSRNTQFEDVDDGTPSAFPDAATIRTGEEEMLLFPSYATKHVRNKPQSVPGTVQETSGAGRDARDSTGAGDAEFWRQEWERYEDDHAIVDVDVRGWIYSPFKGQMSRKQRLFVGLARQMVGLPAPVTESTSSGNSRNPSPVGHRERIQAQAARKEEELVTQQAESLTRRGEQEAAAAGRGQYSERPGRDSDGDSLAGGSRTSSPRRPSRVNELRQRQSQSSLRSETSGDNFISPIQKRASWNQPANMSQAELQQAHTHLMTRLKPFMAIPLANTAISVFFYNNEISRQRTVHTNAAGHFSVRAALDFIPTHVRVLASEKLSSTIEVQVTSSKGVSLISDIDDTIKHSAISVGAREIFRNAFIRELDDLTIEGVQEWYNRLADLGVKFHYVSNSPWQIYPVIAKFFALAGLPPGSFHLKQYSGMLQGIFEPVAERKKGTLDRLARDFPERKFILVGDSGEADLEVYLDFVAENPGRVIAVFIRDVTTSHHNGFFDSSMSRLGGGRSTPGHASGAANAKGVSPASSNLDSDEDPEFKAAIEASIRQLEEEERRRGRPATSNQDQDTPEGRPRLPARRPTGPGALEAHQMEQPVGNLIDFSDDEYTGLQQAQSTLPSRLKQFAPSNDLHELSDVPSRKSVPPVLPKKPETLRSNSGTMSSPSYQTPAITNQSKPPPPPKPRRTSASVVAPPGPTAQSSTGQPSFSAGPPSSYAARPLPTTQQSYVSAARQKLSSAYNSIPTAREARDYLYGAQPADSAHRPPDSFAAPSTYNRGPPPPPARRTVSTYPSTQANSQYSQAQPYSTASNGNWDGQPEMSKREQLWRQRWARAQQIMREKGVVLRTWRVGTDVCDESARLVEKALREAGECDKRTK